MKRTMVVYRVKRYSGEATNDPSSGNTALAVGAGSLAGAAGARAIAVNQTNKLGESMVKDLGSQGINATFDKAGFFKKGKLTAGEAPGTLGKVYDSAFKNGKTALKAGGAGLASAGLGLAGVGALGYGLYKKSQNNN